jgi:hypothetical protein
MIDIEDQFDRANEAAAKDAGHVTQQNSWEEILAAVRREDQRRRGAWMNGDSATHSPLQVAMPRTPEEYQRLAARNIGSVQGTFRGSAAMVISQLPSRPPKGEAGI